MAVKDLTQQRIKYIRSALEDFLDDFKTLETESSSKPFDENFSSARKQEQSLERQLKYPSEYYSFKWFSVSVEIKSARASGSYIVDVVGVDLAELLKRPSFTDYDKVDLLPNAYRFTCFVFNSARVLFQQIVGFLCTGSSSPSDQLELF